MFVFRSDSSSSSDSEIEELINMSKVNSKKMTVVKRDGREESIHFDKITSRIEKLCYGLDMDYIDPTQITLKVINGLYTGVTTVELDNLAAEIAATMTTRHPDYAILAARYEHFLCLAIEIYCYIQNICIQPP